MLQKLHSFSAKVSSFSSRYRCSCAHFGSSVGPVATALILSDSRWPQRFVEDCKTKRGLRRNLHVRSQLFTHRVSPAAADAELPLPQLRPPALQIMPTAGLLWL